MSETPAEGAEALRFALRRAHEVLGTLRGRSIVVGTVQMQPSVDDAYARIDALLAGAPAPDAAAASILPLRPEVRRFAAAMEERLRAYDADRGHRGWAGDNPERLLVRLREEMAELVALLPRPCGCREAICDHWPRAIDGQAVLAEAADAGNFLMMVADVCGGIGGAPAQPAAPVDVTATNAERVRVAVENAPVVQIADLPPHVQAAVREGIADAKAGRFVTQAEVDALLPAPAQPAADPGDGGDAEPRCLLCGGKAPLDDLGRCECCRTPHNLAAEAEADLDALRVRAERAERVEATLERVRALAEGEKRKAAIIAESAAPLDGDLAHQWHAVAHVCGQVLAVLDGGESN